MDFEPTGIRGQSDLSGSQPRRGEPAGPWKKYKLIDLLIVGAFIEARSCERFSTLVPVLEGDIARFYSGLLSSEARHFQAYLELAQQKAETPIDDRIAEFAEIEAELIMRPDKEFRFHSGIPVMS